MKRIACIAACVLLLFMVAACGRPGGGVDDSKKGEDTMTEESKAIISFLGCEYEWIQNTDKGVRVMERFRALTEQGKTEGFFPLIIIPSVTLLESLEFTMEDSESPEAGRNAVLQAAQETNAQDVFAEQMQEREEGWPSEEDWEEMLGEFEPVGQDSFSYENYGAYKGEPELIIAKIPAEHPWELAAWVPMGGFNECPMPAQQVAVFRYWYEQYGAVPRLVSYDIWEMTVAKAPQIQAQAEALAKEQYAFCFDIVDQGAGTIRALAGGLIDSPLWQFWWD